MMITSYYSIQKQDIMPTETMTILALGVPESFKIYLREQLSPLALLLQDVRTEQELSTLLGKRGLQVHCVLMDSDNFLDKGQKFSRTARTAHSTVPIVMLSSEKEKQHYINAIQWGVSAFVMKPLRDDTLRKKLLTYAPNTLQRSTEFITFDLYRYLVGEHRKAAKGGYGLTVLFATVVPQGAAGSITPASLAYYGTRFADSVQAMLWETDAFLKYNTRYYLGVFPFCTADSREILEEKLRDTFLALCQERSMAESVRLATAFASYPEDGEDYEELMGTLVHRVEELVSGTGIALLVQRQA